MVKYIKSILIWIVLIFLVSFFFLSRNEYILGNRVKDSVLGDIDGDGNEEFIVLTKELFNKFGKDVIIYSNEDELTELYREVFADINPWKLDISDVDADGFDELSVGVYKDTIFHKTMAKRPFLYDYNGVKLIPKWRGSRLSRPLTEYSFYDLDNDGCDEIISIEELEDGRKILNSYKWRGFGFEGFIEGEPFDDLYNLYIDNEIFISVKEGKEEYREKVIIKDASLVIERMD